MKPDTISTGQNLTSFFLCYLYLHNNTWRSVLSCIAVLYSLTSVSFCGLRNIYKRRLVYKLNNPVFVILLLIYMSQILLVTETRSRYFAFLSIATDLVSLRKSKFYTYSGNHLTVKTSFHAYQVKSNTKLIHLWFSSFFSPLKLTE